MFYTRMHVAYTRKIFELLQYLFCLYIVVVSLSYTRLVKWFRAWSLHTIYRGSNPDRHISSFDMYLCTLPILYLVWCHTVEVYFKIMWIDCPYFTLISQEILKKSTETHISICRKLKVRSIDIISFSLLHIFTQLFPVNFWI